MIDKLNKTIILYVLMNKELIIFSYTECNTGTELNKSKFLKKKKIYI
jgi:hypothetical protein